MKKKKPSQNKKQLPDLNKQKVNIFQNISSDVKYKSGFSNHGCSDKALGLLCPTQEGTWAAQTNKWVFLALEKEVVYAQTTGNQVSAGKIQTHATNSCCAPPEAFCPNASGNSLLGAFLTVVWLRCATQQTRKRTRLSTRSRTLAWTRNYHGY